MCDVVAVPVGLEPEGGGPAPLLLGEKPKITVGPGEVRGDSQDTDVDGHAGGCAMGSGSGWHGTKLPWPPTRSARPRSRC
jgi:hypothetical protein